MKLQLNPARKNALIICALIAAQAAFLIPMALQRLVARDEGYYLLAAKEVMQGKLPYLDFFYPQMPLLPYIYGGWMSLFGMTWNAGRILSALLTILIGVLLYKRCADLFGRGWGVAAAAAFCLSAMVFSIFTTVTTYALSTLLLFISYLLAARADQSGRKSLCAAAGAAFGLAIDTRLLFGGLYPAFILYMLMAPRPLKEKLKFCAYFSLGMAAAVLPNLLLMAGGLEAFYFNNLGYHLLRSDGTPAQALAHKGLILRILLGVSGSEKFESFQFPILVYLNLISSVFCAWKRIRIDGAFYICALLFLLNFLPKPVYVQYFSALVPFLIVGAIYALRALFRFSAESRGGRPAAASAGVLLMAAYLYGLQADIQSYTVTGKGVIGIGGPNNAKNWNLPRVREISGIIDAQTRPGDKVVSFWPGYLLESHAMMQDGMENHFGIFIAAKLNEQHRRKYKVLSMREAKALLDQKAVPLAILQKKADKTELNKLLKEGKYTLTKRLGRVIIVSTTVTDD